MGNYSRERGREGEEAAWRYLRKKGYTLLARNYRAPSGEVDLVVEKGRIVAFVEVKTRSGDLAEEALEAVDGRKRERIARAARHFLREYNGKASMFRFDVIAVLKVGSGWRVMHVPDAFELEGC